MAPIIQDAYPDDIAVCFGCGRNNPEGWQIRSEWDGKEGTLRFTPDPHHTAYPGIVYGGLIAGLIDCHSVGTAVAAMYQAEGRPLDSQPPILCVTANLNVTYLKPTPLGDELFLQARIKALTSRKAIVRCSLFAGEDECAQAEVVAVRVPSDRLKQTGEKA
jgi:acyl-coenzyme A thioesterase PaaI-like protein